MQGCFRLMQNKNIIQYAMCFCSVLVDISIPCVQAECNLYTCAQCRLMWHTCISLLVPMTEERTILSRVRIAKTLGIRWDQELKELCIATGGLLQTTALTSALSLNREKTAEGVGGMVHNYFATSSLSVLVHYVNTEAESSKVH